MPELETRPDGVDINASSKDFQVRRIGRVWMLILKPNTSAARALAVSVMEELEMDVNDFKMRDRIISAIANQVNCMLDYVDEFAPTPRVDD